MTTMHEPPKEHRYEADSPLEAQHNALLELFLSNALQNGFHTLTKYRINTDTIYDFEGIAVGPLKPGSWAYLVQRRDDGWTDIALKTGFITSNDEVHSQWEILSVQTKYLEKIVGEI